MGPITLQRLIDAIFRNDQVTWDPNGWLAVSSAPSPYMPPKFRFHSTSATGTTAEDKLSVEVIFVQAPAAVGKTITARHISSLVNAPILDLATIGLGGASPDGAIGRFALYGGVRDRNRAIDEFLGGKLPIIIDALDEGQMINPVGFESFLESTAELLMDDRAVKNKPKVVFFGRPEATDLSDIAVQIAGNENITSCVIELDFFTEEDAASLIKQYAIYSLNDSEKLGHDERGARINLLSNNGSNYDDLIALYFKRIESALQMQDGELWRTVVGKAFAGYAPVLSAIGKLLAELDRPHIAINDLQQAGTESAWAVIESVIQYILKREQDKVVAPLKKRFGNLLDESALKNAYGPQEQLAYLAQTLQGRSITPTGAVRFLVPLHNQVYIENVRNFCSDHAFMRKGSAANDVFESFILANAITAGLLSEDAGRPRLEYLSRSPFLWRCFWHNYDKSMTLSGQYIGILLRSYCNDPLTEQSSKIQICEGSSDLLVSATTVDENGYSSEVFEINVSAPVQLFGSIADCDIDLPNGHIEVVGFSRREDSGSFRFLGGNAINCGVLEVLTDRLVITGSLLVETVGRGGLRPNLKLTVEKDSRLGVSGAISGVPPWNDWVTGQEIGVDAGIPELVRDVLEVIRKIESKLGTRPFIFTNIHNHLDPHDSSMNWLRRCKGYQQFLNVSYNSGVAHRVPVDRSGTFGQRLEFGPTLVELDQVGRNLILGVGLERNMSREVRDFWRRLGLVD